ncbi:MAG TPA: glycosyltransferase [Flavobacterium sp.]|nr:glycosyltransferase [Flavobacterium sp.]
MLSVVIRNKNEENELAFLLKNLRERYADDVDEIIVLDNLSSDGSEKITNQYNARFVTVEKFSYGESANIAAREASHDLVVIFSAHSFPVSHDFFKLIVEKFAGRENELAGLRCLHNYFDYSAHINGMESVKQPNKAGLNFAGSVFNKRMWREHPFKSDVQTFEDKEWTIRMLKLGYKIEFVPSIFCYHKKRNRAQTFFRFKNDVIGSYQLFHTNPTFPKAVKDFLMGGWKTTRHFFSDIWYVFRRFFFMLKFLSNKPNRF